MKIYDRWGNFYDIIFKGIFSEGRDVGVKLLDLRAGERLLEVGVGTGLSLPLYRRDTSIVGIDISSKMLEKAQEKIEKYDLRNVQLEVMDAQAMDFPDSSFDCVTACYVVSAAPDPHKVVSEICRVCKPGGRIVFINHFKSLNPLIGAIEGLIEPIGQRLGFSTTLDLHDLLKEIKLEPVLERPVNLFKLWRIVKCINDK